MGQMALGERYVKPALTCPSERLAALNILQLSRRDGHYQWYLPAEKQSFSRDRLMDQFPRQACSGGFGGSLQSQFLHL
jgi:hypothetical protein